jgi:hypothetical protein
MFQVVISAEPMPSASPTRREFPGEHDHERADGE